MKPRQANRIREFSSLFDRAFQWACSVSCEEDAGVRRCLQVRGPESMQIRNRYGTKIEHLITYCPVKYNYRVSEAVLFLDA